MPGLILKKLQGIGVKPHVINPFPKKSIFFNYLDYSPEFCVPDLYYLSDCSRTSLCWDVLASRYKPNDCLLAQSMHIPVLARYTSSIHMIWCQHTVHKKNVISKDLTQENMLKLRGLKSQTIDQLNYNMNMRNQPKEEMKSVVRRTEERDE